MPRLMRIAPIATLLTLACTAAQADVPGVRTQPLELTKAVVEFNQKAKHDPVGKSQPLLTADEVLAAILMWDRNRMPIDDELYSKYVRIALSQSLTPEFSIKSMNRCTQCAHGLSYQVWWVDLEYDDGDSGYRFRIRDRRLGIIGDNIDDKLHIPGQHEGLPGRHTPTLRPEQDEAAGV